METVVENTFEGNCEERNFQLVKIFEIGAIPESKDREKTHSLSVKCEFVDETISDAECDPLPSSLLPLVKIEVEENLIDDKDSKDSLGTPHGKRHCNSMTFIDVPILVGTTVDESASFMRPSNCRSSAKEVINKGNNPTPMSALKMPKKSSTSSVDMQRYKCDKCSAVFPYLSRFKTHRLNHDGERPYSCDQCDMTFKSKGNLVTHKISHVDTRPFLCLQCGRSFKMKTTLQKHRKIHTPVMFSMPQHLGTDKEQANKIDENDNQKKKVKCPYCDMSFCSPSKLSVHVVIHTGERPHRCRFCGETFTQKSHLYQHFRMHHPDLKHYSCPYCGLDFVKNQELTAHKKFCLEQHGCALKIGKALKREEYTCDVCSAVFMFRGKLFSHKKEVHGDDRPFRCLDCGQSFKKMFHLDKHKMLHTGDRPYICHECGNAFTQQSHLRTHQRTHTGERPYRCDVCGACFFQSCHLKAHKFIHTGKPYICEICQKRFSQKTHLRSHQKVHQKSGEPDSIENIYRCALCVKVFTAKRKLIVHFEYDH